MAQHMWSPGLATDLAKMILAYTNTVGQEEQDIRKWCKQFEGDDVVKGKDGQKIKDSIEQIKKQAAEATKIANELSQKVQRITGLTNQAVAGMSKKAGNIADDMEQVTKKLAKQQQK